MSKEGSLLILTITSGGGILILPIIVEGIFFSQQRRTI